MWCGTSPSPGQEGLDVSRYVPRQRRCGARPTDPCASHNWLVVDTETTGLSKADRVIEVGVVFGEGAEATGDWSCLVNPGCSVEGNRAAQVHGITDAELADAPSFAQVAEQVADLLFLPGRQVWAYNAPFDHRMLMSELDSVGIVSAQPAVWMEIQDVLELLPLDLKLWRADGRRQRAKLSAVVNKLGWKWKDYEGREHQAHRALGDAHAAAHVLTTAMRVSSGRMAK